MRTTSFLILLVLSLPLSAQVQLERNLLASAGNQVQLPSIRIEQSIGDLMVASSSTSDLVLTQGFQQTYDFSTTVSETATGELLVYPNPTCDRVTIQWAGSATGTADVQLYDLLGKIMWSGRVPLSEQFEVDLSDRAAGIYSLRVNPESSTAVVVRVQKVR